MPIPLLTAAVWAGIVVWPFWKITTRVGYPGWLSLLMVVPLVNVAYLYFLAFSTWPSVPDSEQAGHPVIARNQVSPTD